MKNLSLKFALSLMALLVLNTNTNAHTYAEQEEEEIFDTAWDILNILYDAGKISIGYVTGNPVMVNQGWVDLGVDGLALVIPGLPAGSSKIASAGMKEATRQGTKHGAKVSMQATAETIDHIVKRHGSESAEYASKFFVNSKEEIVALMYKAKDRIKNGFGILNYNTITKQHYYVVDMGESIGKMARRQGRNGAPHVYSNTPTNYVLIAIDPNPKGGKGFGSFYPCKGNKFSNLRNGFQTAVLK